MPRSSLEQNLRRLLPSGAVSASASDIAAHSGDKWFASHAPEVVVFASSTSDVSRLLAYAARRGAPVTARGAGYGYVGGCVPARGGIALSLARMNRILEINPRDFTAVVQAGVITGDLIRKAARAGMFYPPDPASLDNSTIGGNVATNAGGPRCLKYGVTKAYVLGLEAVLADGAVVRTGGRTHKNKTGFDLASLFVGSEGMLGVITEVTLKLLPLPPERAALAAVFPALPKAARAVETVLRAGFLPSAMEVADRFTLQAARKRLGAARLPEGDAYLLIEIDGQRASVRSELRLLSRLLDEAGAVRVDSALGAQRTEALWQVRREFSESLKATGLIKLNEDVVVPRGRLVDLMRFASGLQRKYGAAVACFGHAGDGNIHVNLMVDNYDSPAVRRKMERALDELFQQVLEWGGAITGEHGVGLAKKRWWRAAASAELRALHKRIKLALDPKGILNPGKFLD